MKLAHDSDGRGNNCRATSPHHTSLCARLRHSLRPSNLTGSIAFVKHSDNQMQPNFYNNPSSLLAHTPTRTNIEVNYHLSSYHHVENHPLQSIHIRFCHYHFPKTAAILLVKVKCQGLCLTMFCFWLLVHDPYLSLLDKILHRPCPSTERLSDFNAPEEMFHKSKDKFEALKMEKTVGALAQKSGDASDQMTSLQCFNSKDMIKPDRSDVEPGTFHISHPCHAVLRWISCAKRVFSSHNPPVRHWSVSQAPLAVIAGQAPLLDAMLQSVHVWMVTHHCPMRSAPLSLFLVNC